VACPSLKCPLALAQRQTGAVTGAAGAVAGAGALAVAAKWQKGDVSGERAAEQEEWVSKSTGG
jgi:hypothetical protein